MSINNNNLAIKITCTLEVHIIFQIPVSAMWVKPKVEKKIYIYLQKSQRMKYQCKALLKTVMILSAL